MDGLGAGLSYPGTLSLLTSQINSSRLLTGYCGFVTQGLEEFWITVCQGKDLISGSSVLSLKSHRGRFLKIQTMKKP